MNIADMPVSTAMIDATQLDEAEQAKVMELLSVYGSSLVTVLMTKGGAAALQFAAGVALRMVKASHRIQPASLEDVKRLG